MKKLLTILVLFFSAGIANAQNNPTFEETVTYITTNIKGRVMYPGDLDAYSRVEGYHLEDVKIERNGKIEFITNQENKSYNYKNNFSIIFNIFDLVPKVDYPDGIMAYKFLVHFNGLNVSSGYGITFATDADAQKVARAFRYLKTLCVKDNDLFSQIPDEEKKPKLSREETISYINNLLYNLPKSVTEQIQKRSAADKDDFRFSYPTRSSFWYSSQPLQYNSNTNKYSLTGIRQVISFYGSSGGNTFNLNNEATFSAKDITGFEEDWDGNVVKAKYSSATGAKKGGYYVVIDIQNKVANMDANPEDEGWGYESPKRDYKYFRVNLTSGGWFVIRYNTSEPKFTSRLKNAFLRLKELDKDNTDPFDN